jgi:hypothetical protein
MAARIGECRRFISFHMSDNDDSRGILPRFLLRQFSRSLIGKTLSGQRNVLGAQGFYDDNRLRG